MRSARWVLITIVVLAWPELKAGADETFAAGLASYQARHYQKARTLFVRCAAEGLDDVEVDFYLGRLALWFDEGNEALRHLERAARLAPNDARVQNALGDAYGLMAQNAGLLSKLGWAKKCRAAYERAVRLAPANTAFRWSLLGYNLVAPRIAGGGYDRALAQAEEIRRLDSAEGRSAFATIYLADKKTAAAFAQFDAVLALSPDDVIALYHVGRCAALSGEQLERGKAALQRCLELSLPEGEAQPTRACVHYRLSNILEQQGDATGAKAELEAAMHEHPDFRPAKIQLRN